MLLVLVAPRELRETPLLVYNVSLHAQADILRRVVEDFHRLLRTIESQIAHNTHGMQVGSWCALVGEVTPNVTLW